MARFLIWVAPLAIVAAPAFAQATTDVSAVDAAHATAPAPPAAKERKVCRKFEVTGRRIAQTECHTAQQWAEYDAASAEAAKKFVTGVNSSSATAGLSGGSSGGLSTGAIFGLGPQ